MSILVAMTGASGNMGQPTVQQLMQLPDVVLRLLLLDEKRERRLAKRWTRLYGDRIEILFGDLKNATDCERLVDGAQYVLNLAAVIPPLADKHPDWARDANVAGVANLVAAVEAQTPQPKFIHISTVAIYGNRDYLHPWGRVGDPLLPSVYDTYALGKLMGERMVLDSRIRVWAILRQTGMLYEKLLMSNIADGLMFHTCFNTPIEWASDHDSGVLIRNVIAQDMADGAPRFWQRVYNIGGGAAYRTTGYDTFDMGFAMIGGGVKKFMRPNWHATRNFHCIWFADSDELEEQFHFQSKSFADFWKEVRAKNKYFALAKLLPPSAIRAMIFKPLLKDANAPYRWVRDGNAGRIKAFFGSKAEWDAIGEDWGHFAVWSKNQVAGHDYAREKDVAYAEQCKLSHGYDESKPADALSAEDLTRAAAFRGGKCDASAHIVGDWHTKLTWQCADGHAFRSSAYTVLKAGHWCPHCLAENHWRWDHLAKNNPFYGQIWYDTHARDENTHYYYDEAGVAQMETDD